MAKFCTKCGAELVEGKCPKCKEEKTVKKVETTSNNDFVSSLKDCLVAIKKIITKPIEVIEEFVTENKFISGVIMIALTAISTGLYKVASLKHIYSTKSANSVSADDLADLFSQALSGGNIKSAEPNYFEEFFKTTLLNLVEFAAIAAIAYLVISQILKGTSTFKEMVSAVGIALLVVFAANVINSLLVMFDGEILVYIRSYIFQFANLFKYLIIAGAIYKTAGIKKEQIIVSTASIFVCATVVMDIIDKVINK